MNTSLNSPMFPANLLCYTVMSDHYGRRCYLVLPLLVVMLYNIIAPMYPSVGTSLWFGPYTCYVKVFIELLLFIVWPGLMILVM